MLDQETIDRIAKKAIEDAKSGFDVEIAGTLLNFHAILDDACHKTYKTMWRLGCIRNDCPTHIAIKELREFAEQIIKAKEDGVI